MGCGDLGGASQLAPWSPQKRKISKNPVFGYYALMINDKIFKAYDIRGIYPDEINEEAAKRIAGAYAFFIKPKQVAVGRDVRISSPSLHRAVVEGLIEAGVDVIDIGLVPSELLSFTIDRLELDGGIQVTGSHNNGEYNGLYLYRKGVEAISSDNGLQDIKQLVLSDQDFSIEKKGRAEKKDLLNDYIDFLANYIDLTGVPPLKIVANNNFGVTGPLVERFFSTLGIKQIEIIPLNFDPDGHFPKGQPDPLVLENRAETSELVSKHQAQLAVAWDADGDRCYLADENGLFIEGCHLTAILAEHLLKKHPGDKIVYDPRNIWAVEETVKQAGGTALMNKAGHTFIKARMRSEKALFAGEMSGHFYFRDFFGADNGILPFLYFLEIIKETGLPVSKIVAPYREKYFVSGEVNFKVGDVASTLKKVEEKYSNGQIDRIDGLSVSYDNWRFNLRSSNTEPLLRLNVEAKDRQTCETKLEELTGILAIY
jgi:phosphomannomutase